MKTCRIPHFRLKQLALLAVFAGAPAALADIRTWDGGAILGSSWNSANNWSSNTVPTSSGTAAFSTGNNGKTTIAFTNLDTTVSEILFLANSPAYRFNVSPAPLLFLPPTLTISGPGIVNTSTNTQTFAVSALGKLAFTGTANAGGNVLIANTLVGSTVFSEASTAGAATISNDSGGFTTFSDTANAGSAIITSGSLGFLNFTGSSNAASATITNTLGGLATFSDSSSAGSSNITNSLVGATRFTEASTAGGATIANSAGGLTSFSGSSNAGSATITSGSLSATTFSDQSHAATANITNSNGGLAAFTGGASAANATIINNLLGLTTFSGSSTAGASNINNSLGGFTTFSDTANAGTSNITNQLAGATSFSGSSTAGTATIKNSLGGFTFFTEDSNAGGATIQSGTLGATTFSERSSASTANITNSEGGLAAFLDNATAGNATIVNKFLGATTFSGSSTAGTANIHSGTLGAAFFTGNSNAESSSITNSEGGLTTFSDNANASASTILNTVLGGTLFTGDSDAGSARITNRLLGVTTFAGDASAGTARITNRFLGATLFLDDSTADQTRINNRFGGAVDLSGHNGALAIGSVRGSGDIFLGGNELALGGLNTNARISGVIRDGGLSGGTGGSLTKNGLGRLTLTRANTYTGGTTINEGLLRTINSSALGTGPVALNGGTLHTIGDLNVGTFTWTGGEIRLLPQIGSVVNVSGDFLNGGSGGTYAINTTGMNNGDTYVLTTFTGSTNFTVGNFTGNFTHINPNVQYQGQFSLQADRVVLQITGATATGEILQNSFPVLIPTFADFFVAGNARTGFPWENNIINSLTFANQSSLQVFNYLTVITGNFNVPSGTATVNGGTIVTPANFEKNGEGTLVANSDFSIAGQALVKAGQLIVNANFLVQQGLTVFQNALLGGSGVIFGDVLNNGTVSPGNSPGTLTIVGNYVQSPGGTFQLEIASLSVFDRLMVTGNASLAGTLQVIAGNLKYGQQYTFLQAGSIDGEFDRILMPNPSRFRGRLLVDGGAGTLLVAPTSYTLVAKTGNQRNVARALDSYIPARGNDRETVSIALDLQTENQYPAAFDAISPAFYESLADISIEQVNAQNQMLAQRLSAVRLGTRGFQATGFPASPLVHDKDGKSVLDAKDGKDILTPAPTTNGAYGFRATASSPRS